MRGFFLEVEKENSKDVQVQLRVRDISRQRDSYGTELPIVREGEAFAEPFQLLDVPIDSTQRVMLRIYEFGPELSPGSAAVRVFGIDPTMHRPDRVDELLAEFTVPFRFARAGGGSRSHPGYAEVAYLAGLARGYSRLRVEIRPVDALSRLWAFVSVTNNETQHVTTLTPQQQ